MARSAEGARRGIAGRAGDIPVGLSTAAGVPCRRWNATGGAGPRSARESMTGAAKPGGNSLSAELAEWRSAAALCAAQAGSKPSERCFSGAKRA